MINQIDTEKHVEEYHKASEDIVYNVFNTSFKEYEKAKTEDNLKNLSKSISCINSRMEYKQLDINNKDIEQFFVNLYQLIGMIDPESPLLLPSLKLLEIITKNSSAKTVILDRCNFVPIIGKILESIKNSNIRINLLTILEQLSFEISITWQEPYLEGIIKFLINSIHTQENEIQKLALSCLVNLCYKNLPAMYLLLKNVCPDEFLNKIKTHKALMCKMSFLLESNMERITRDDVENFIKTTFIQISQAIRIFDIRQLAHNCALFKDLKSHEKLSSYFYDYENYHRDLLNIFEFISSAKEKQEKLSDCMTIIFDFWIFLINLLGEKEYECALKIVRCSLQWIYPEKTGLSALDVLTTFFQNFDICARIELMDEVFNQITKALIMVTDLQSVSSKYISSLCKLLNILLCHQYKYKIPNDVLLKFLRHTVFKNFFSDEADHASIEVLALPYIKMCVYALELLAQVEKLEEMVDFHLLLKSLLNMPAVQIIIANAMLIENKDICKIIFKLTRIKDFPFLDIGKKLTCNGSRALAGISSDKLIEESPGYFVVTNTTNSTIERRLNELVNKMLETAQNHGTVSISMSDILELFEFKISVSSNNEKDQLSRLDEYNVDIANLSQKISKLLAEVTKYQAEKFSLEMHVERLTLETCALETESNNLLECLEESKDQIENEYVEYAKLSAELKMKEQLIEILETDIGEKKTQLTYQQTTIEELFITFEEEKQLRNSLKDIISNMENIQNLLEKQIREQNEALIKANRDKEQLENEKNYLIEKLDALEIEVGLKDQALKNFDTHLKAVGENNKQVLSLLQNVQR